MKKLKYLLLGIIVFLVPTFVMANEKVTVNIFKSSTCPHCSEALEFFEELQKDNEYSKYFELALFETNGSSDAIIKNIELAEKVSKYFGNEFEGVPLIVIGEQYFEGYISSMDEELKEAIKNAYSNDSYVDIVSEFKNGNIKNSNFGSIMTILIVLVFVGGLGYLVYIGRKNPLVEEVIEKEEKKDSKEEKVETKTKPKKTSTKKKTTTKKTSSIKK